MLLSFKTMKDCDEEVWINPHYVAAVLFEGWTQWGQRSIVHMASGQKFGVLDEDKMVAKIIRDAQFE